VVRTERPQLPSTIGRISAVQCEPIGRLPRSALGFHQGPSRTKKAVFCVAGPTVAPIGTRAARPTVTRAPACSARAILTGFRTATAPAKYDEKTAQSETPSAT
jgi:hypothetical protein